eukprot:g27577.t1
MSRNITILGPRTTAPLISSTPPPFHARCSAPRKMRDGPSLFRDHKAAVANRKRRREVNKKLGKLKKKYQDSVDRASNKMDKDPQAEAMNRSQSLKRSQTMEGMPTASKTYLSSVSPKDESLFRDILRRYTDSDAIDQSDLRHFLEGVGFKPRSKAERDLMSQMLRSLDSLDIKFEEIIPAIRLGFAETRSAELSKRFHQADVDKSGTLSLSELLHILRWSGYFPKTQHVISAVTEVVPELAESLTASSSLSAILEKDILVPAQFHILAPLLEERSDSEYVQRRIEIAEAMDLDEHTQKLWGQALVDLQDVFLRRAKNDYLPFQSLVHLAVDCGLVQHRGSGFRDKLQSIAAEEVSLQLEVIPRLVEEFDEDGSGELDLDEYLEFAKFVADRIRKMQHVGRMETAHKIGYGDDEYLRLWDAFVAADVDMDGMLEEQEMLQAVWGSRPEVTIDKDDDVDRLHFWHQLGIDAGIEKESVESFIFFWRSLNRNMKEDTVAAKELTKAVKTLPGGNVKMARVRTLQIDFAHFLQVMKVKGSELGDGVDPLSESEFNSPGGPLSPHEPMISPGKSAGSGKMSPAALGSARLTVKRCSAGEAEWEKVEPNAKTFGKLIEGAARVGDTARALHWFHRLSKKFHVDVDHYNMLARAFFVSGDLVTGARWLFEETGKRGIEPDIVGYNQYLDALSVQGRLEHSPNLVTYNSVLNTCASRGAASAAEGWLEEMLERRLRPNLISFNSVLKAYARSKSSGKSTDAAERLFRGMTAAEVAPDLISYNSALSVAVVAWLRTDPAVD